MKRAVVEFFTAPVDPRPLAMFRIFLGAEMLVHYLFLLPHWRQFYARDGVLSLDVPPAYPPMLPPPEDWWSVFRIGDGTVPVHLWWVVGVIAAVCFIVGWRTRVAACVLWVMTTSLIHRTPAVVNGEEMVFRMLTFWSMFAPLGAVWSLDARRDPARAAAAAASGTWAVRCVQINFVLIYLISLPNKLVDDPAWLEGDAIYLSLVSNMWSRGVWPEAGYAWNGLFSKLATWGTIVVEGLAPWLVWWRRTAPFAIIALVGLHVGIAIVLNGVAFFSLSMVVGCWLFAPPEWAEWVYRMAIRARSEPGVLGLPAGKHPG